MNAMDLFSAGSETTATTLAWAVSGLYRHDMCGRDMCEHNMCEIDMCERT